MPHPGKNVRPGPPERRAAGERASLPRDALRSGAPSSAWIVLLLAVTGGLVTGWASRGPWPLVMVGGTALASALALSPGAARAGWAGFLFGSVYFTLMDLPFATYSPRGAMLLIPVRAASLVPVAIAVQWLHHRRRLPLSACFAVAWVGGEFLRMLGPMAIPSGAFALPLTNLDWLLQLAELGGSYLMSLVAASVCGSVAEAVALRLRGAGGVAARLGAAAAIIAATCALGSWLGAETRRGMRPGPVVAVVQPDAPTSAGDGNGFDPELLMRQLRASSEEVARRGPRPDLVLWPETPSGFPVINTEWPAGAADRQEFKAWVAVLGVPVMYGSSAILPGENGAPTGTRVVQNVVTRYDPGVPGESGRQAKRRLFPGGETLPGAEIPMLRRLGEWVAGTDARAGWLTPGTGWTSFAVTNAAGVWPYRVAICSEAMFPETAGSFLPAATGKPMAFLAIAGNLGGFGRNRALPWYFASLRARAVESRIGIACSINTGISGFIRPDGSVHGLVTNAAGQAWTGLGTPEMDRIGVLLRFRAAHEDELATNALLHAEARRQMDAIEAARSEAGVSGASSAAVWVHPRTTWYSRTGDVLGGTSCAAMLLAALIGTAAALRAQFRLPSRRRLH